MLLLHENLNLKMYSMTSIIIYDTIIQKVRDFAPRPSLLVSGFVHCFPLNPLSIKVGYPIAAPELSTGALHHVITPFSLALGLAL